MVSGRAPRGQRASARPVSTIRLPVAAIALTLRRRKSSKYVDPATQIKVRREDRVRIVKMPAEKKT